MDCSGQGKPPKAPPARAHSDNYPRTKPHSRGLFGSDGWRPVLLLRLLLPLFENHVQPARISDEVVALLVLFANPFIGK